ncbi:nascent polypeptide-associated complex subunit alpha [Monosporozyma unispora]|nr:GAL4 enhancer protein [Kazachstania unispora]
MEQINKNNDNGENATEDESIVIAENQQYAKNTLLKSNYKRIAGINRVTVRRMDNQLVIIEDPEVYKASNGTYIVFGDPLIDNFGQKLVIAQQQARQSALLPSYANGEEEMTYDELDIKLIMEQSDCTENEAMHAYRMNHGDVVSSIFEVCQGKTMG